MLGLDVCTTMPIFHGVVVLGFKPKALCMLSQHSADWAPILLSDNDVVWVNEPWLDVPVGRCVEAQLYHKS